MFKVRVPLLTILSLLVAMTVMAPVARAGYLLQWLNSGAGNRPQWGVEREIFSPARVDPIGVRILVIPWLDRKENAALVAELADEFATNLRSFANESILLQELPDGPVRQHLNQLAKHVLLSYKAQNRLEAPVLDQMLMSFDIDFIAVFEVANYDQYWNDLVRETRVGVRATFYDTETGLPVIEAAKFAGRGKSITHGAFDEAEQLAVRGLINDIEVDLRGEIAAKEALRAKYAQQLYKEAERREYCADHPVPQRWKMFGWWQGARHAEAYGMMPGACGGATPATMPPAAMQQPVDSGKQAGLAAAPRPDRYREMMAAQTARRQAPHSRGSVPAHPPVNPPTVAAGSASGSPVTPSDRHELSQEADRHVRKIVETAEKERKKIIQTNAKELELLAKAAQYERGQLTDQAKEQQQQLQQVVSTARDDLDMSQQAWLEHQGQLRKSETAAKRQRLLEQELTNSRQQAAQMLSGTGLPSQAPAPMQTLDAIDTGAVDREIYGKIAF